MSEFKHYRFVLEGRVKPYVRMTRAGKFVRKQAREYLNSQMAIGLQLKSQMAGREMFPRGVPLVVHISFHYAGGWHNRDLDNEIKAMLDAAQGVVFEDDRWIDVVQAGRHKAMRDGVRLAVWPRMYGDD